jgi:SAM-dependent methyltransferase
VCGATGRFARDRRAIGASYQCPSCGSSLRYQGQARVLVAHFARHGARSFAALCQEPEFRDLRIWEPGDLGPFRAHLRDLPGYSTSSYFPDVPGGALRDGVRCEDLMALTYPSSSFDLVITSDVFEHVRRPYLGFSEVHRVLRPGGAHVFSIPVRWPLRPATVPRVDTSGDDDVHLLEPAYHRSHLVYNDFGADLLDRLTEIGFDTEVVRFASDNPPAARLVTFCSVKHS